MQETPQLLRSRRNDRRPHLWQTMGGVAGKVKMKDCGNQKGEASVPVACKKGMRERQVEEGGQWDRQ